MIRERSGLPDPLNHNSNAGKVVRVICQSPKGHLLASTGSSLVTWLGSENTIRGLLPRDWLVATTRV